MKKLKFRYARATNFMCFGPDGIELFFEDYDNVVLVRGLNLDYAGGDPEDASNGTGKSSLQDLLSWVLYGKTVKKPKQLDHGTVINTLYKKGLEGEVQVDEYRILRGREPNKLRIWKSKDHLWDKDSEITKGTMAETQKVIEKDIIGLSHAAFCNVVVFDDSNNYCFLELDAAGKRTVVENLLGLDRYREHHDTAKEMLKEVKSKVKDLTKDYERYQDDIDASKKRIEKVQQQETNWVKVQGEAIVSLKKKLKEKQTELEGCDNAEGLKKYEDAQVRIADLEAKIPDLEAKKAKIASALVEARTKLNEARNGRDDLSNAVQERNLKLRQLKADIDKSNGLVRSLETLDEGQNCPTCHGEISKDNYNNVLLHEKNCIEGAKSTIKKELASLEEDKQRLEKRDALIGKLDQYIADADSKLAEAQRTLDGWRADVTRLAKIERPDAGLKERMLEQHIVELKQQLQAKEAEALNSPYKEILESALKEKTEKEDECEVKVKELRDAEKMLPYYDYWVDAFGDKGIRKYVVDGIIPALNARVAYWMQYLIDSKIELTFDNQLNETINRNGVEAYYHAMSNGEKRRINLAVSQAFAYVMMLNSGNCPSLVFLDEITGGGIDKAGVSGVYNMIFELAKERQVFVTTHNQTLLDMLQGCGTITLVKKDDITKLAS